MGRIRTINSDRTKHLYCIVERGTDYPCKVGMADQPHKRLSSLQAGNWRPLELDWAIPFADADDCKTVEQVSLSRFRPNVYGGRVERESFCSEWIDCTSGDLWDWVQQMIESSGIDVL